MVIYQSILKTIGGNPNNIEAMTNEALEYMFWLYDSYFFNETFQRHFEKYPESSLTIKFGHGHSEHSGVPAFYEGLCTAKGCNYTILIDKTVFNLLFKTLKHERECVNGIECSNQLECVQIVMEHEMVHLLTYMYYPPKSGHSYPFQFIATNIFGHTATTHLLGYGCSQKEYIMKAKEYVRLGMVVKTYSPHSRVMQTMLVVGTQPDYFTGTYVTGQGVTIQSNIPYEFVILPGVTAGYLVDLLHSWIGIPED